MLRSALMALTVAALAASCSPLDPSPGTDRLLVDHDSSRYGRLIRHNNQAVLPIVRGDGIAELFVHVQIGTTRGWWQIDTGAAFSVVTTRVARHEGFVPLKSGKIMTAAGTVRSQLGTLPSVRLGGWEIRRVTALSLDEHFANDFTVRGKRGQVIGILGADLLDHLGAIIDLRSDSLRFRTP